MWAKNKAPSIFRPLMCKAATTTVRHQLPTYHCSFNCLITRIRGLDADTLNSSYQRGTALSLGFGAAHPLSLRSFTLPPYRWHEAREHRRRCRQQPAVNRRHSNPSFLLLDLTIEAPGPWASWDSPLSPSSPPCDPTPSLFAAVRTRGRHHRTRPTSEEDCAVHTVLYVGAT